MFLMSLRRGDEEFPVPCSDFTLLGLTASEGGGELLWGGDTGGLELSSGVGNLAPAPRALNADAIPEVNGEWEDDIDDAGDE